MLLRLTSRFLRPYIAAVLLVLLLPMWRVNAQEHEPLVATSNDAASFLPDSLEDQQQAASQATGTVSGTIIDQQGALAVGAQVKLEPKGGGQPQQAVSGDDGQFSFSNVSPGPFELTVSAPGFQTKTFSGTVSPGQVFLVPQMVLPIAAASTDVKVSLTPEEAAVVEVQEQYKQKVLGFIPNYYASYVPDAAPLPPRLKFQLAWKSVTNPVTFLGVAMLAGMYQAGDQLSGYGQGMAGYGDRLGAAYGDVFLGTFIDSAVFPTLFHQDPRYFYKGTGTIKSRLAYALENAVICRGDNGKRQFNYSAVVGSFVTSGISYTYYPAANRGGGLMAQSALVRIAEGSLAGVFQEFVVKKLTPHLKKQQADQP
jgi:Carboxypeptidase regulatory-like domain